MKTSEENGGGGGGDSTVTRRRVAPSRQARTPNEGSGKEKKQESFGSAVHLGCQVESQGISSR